jgi:hypothetical protein
MNVINQRRNEEEIMISALRLQPERRRPMNAVSN